MQDDQVTPAEYVTKRPNSLVWQYARPLPKEFAHRFPPKKQWLDRGSLGTRSLPEANRLARIRTGEWEARLQQWGLEDNAQAVERISPEQAAALAERVAHKVLQADEALRGDPKAMQAMGRLTETLKSAARAGLRIGRGPAPAPDLPPYLTDELNPWDGQPDELFVGLEALNDAGDQHAADAFKRQKLTAIERQAQAEARALGFTFTRATPGALEALRACLGAYREAWAGVRARDAGRVVVTPPLPVYSPPAPKAPTAGAGQANDGRRMRDALEAWEGLKPRKPKTVSVFRRHVEQFATMAGDPLLSSIGPAEAERFREALQRWAVENGKTKETADNVLSSIKALATVAANPARGWMTVNPFLGLSVEAGGKETEGREPWTPDELPRLFASPVFDAYRVPPGETAAERKAGLDAAYWVPLLCLFTGARPGEVCQLWTDDLSEVPDSDGAPLLVLEFRENKERGQSLKNPSSWRALPVHPELIRLGFRDYWQAIEEQQGKPGALFPALQTKGANGHAGQFGQWFGEFKKARGFDTTKTLHSFRHTVETELAFAEVSPTLVDAITGHEGQGIGRKQYGATIRRNAVRLRPHLERLQFPGLDLPRAFKAPVWKPRKV